MESNQTVGLLTDLSNDGLLPDEVFEDFSDFSAGQPLDSDSDDDDSDRDVTNDSDSEEGEDDDGDDPLVFVADDLEAEPAPEGEEWGPEDCSNRHLLQRARTRNCKASGGFCKHKTATGTTTQHECRQGCVVQFTPEEIVALQLSVQDMTRGMYIK
jgi:hypothetical protein